jgi:hypothetical protein
LETFSDLALQRLITDCYGHSFSGHVCHVTCLKIMNVLPAVFADVDATNPTTSPIEVTTSAAAVNTARGAAERVPDEQRLYENLLVDYEPSVRPVLNTSGTVYVNFKLTLNQIVDLVGIT